LGKSEQEGEKMSGETLKEIFEAVGAGQVEKAPALVQKAMNEGISVDEILKKGLIAAMDLVGERFGEGEMFIPQVLWAAKAMQASMDLLRPHLSSFDSERMGKVIIGTAQGDIHDIGKNLVAIMLEGAGFEVIDLGVDVEAERFVKQAAENKADVIAISALLTTTMQSMSDVVSSLKEKGLSSVKVIIGGAPVDQAFCDEIGADAYGVDAMDGVRRINELIQRFSSKAL
jgi:5-methyltetrahydrofolate--homocysteine methyltransferase